MHSVHEKKKKKNRREKRLHIILFLASARVIGDFDEYTSVDDRGAGRRRQRFRQVCSDESLFPLPPPPRIESARVVHDRRTDTKNREGKNAYYTHTEWNIYRVYLYEGFWYIYIILRFRLGHTAVGEPFKRVYCLRIICKYRSVTNCLVVPTKRNADYLKFRTVLYLARPTRTKTRIIVRTTTNRPVTSSWCKQKNHPVQ